ncbi:MAG TPA: threonine synthase [Melioribacteraceae bacterium]|nr:threonine synthase [Melioribacteraceae bacterium]
MNNYFYKCFDCGKEYSATQIENNFVYLCPICGMAERNKPLRGVFTVEYDYNSIKKKLSRKKFLNLSPGKFLNYKPLWPLKKYPPDEILNRLELNSSPVLKYKVDGREIFFFDDTRNPTLSYKDRASSLVVLKALELGVKEISAASTGNAGSSLAGIASRLGVKSHIFVPSSIPEAKRIQIQAYGASIYPVDGTYDDAFDICLEISSAKKIYNRNTAYNPLTIEGKKSAAFDMFIQLKGELPDYIFVPVGDGVIISGLFKGFYDLKKLGWINKIPKLIGVQAKGSDALVRYMKNGEFRFKKADTIADSISAAAPRNLYMAAQSISITRGSAIAVSDQEILKAQLIISRTTGLFVEPSCAASYAGYKKFINRNPIQADSKIMLMMTGNGLKDTEAAAEQFRKPDSLSIKQIMKIFRVK